GTMTCGIGMSGCVVPSGETAVSVALLARLGICELRDMAGLVAGAGSGVGAAAFAAISGVALFGSTGTLRIRITLIPATTIAAARAAPAKPHTESQLNRLSAGAARCACTDGISEAGTSALATERSPESMEAKSDSSAARAARQSAQTTR